MTSTTPSTPAWLPTVNKGARPATPNPEPDNWPEEVPRDGLDDQVNALIRELLDSQDLDNIPSLEPLVADVLFLDTVTRLHGPSGTFKSFLTLSLAGAVGTGSPWHGRTVRQGNVVYIVAEGAKGMRKRVRAWEQHYGLKMTGVKFLPRPVQVRSPEWAVLIEACRRLEVALIVIDTQARVTVGVNENDNTEMGVVLDLMERLRVVTGACVLVVHHSGHENSERGRGASAVKGGMQTELSVSRKGKELADTCITLDMPKQKDDEEGVVGTFRPQRVHLHGEAKEDGSPVTSVVLIPDVAPEGTPEWIVQQLDAANVPTDWGSPRVIQACSELGIKARKSKIEEAVRARKNRHTDPPPEAGGGRGAPPPPAQGGHQDNVAGQTSPGTGGGGRGRTGRDLPPPAPLLGRGEVEQSTNSKDGPTGVCDVCFKVMTKLRPDQTRHFYGCE